MYNIRTESDFQTGTKIIVTVNEKQIDKKHFIR